MPQLYKGIIFKLNEKNDEYFNVTNDFYLPDILPFEDIIMWEVF